MRNDSLQVHKETGDCCFNKRSTVYRGSSRHEHEGRVAWLGINMHRLACSEYVDGGKGALRKEHHPKNAMGAFGIGNGCLDLRDKLLACRALSPRRHMFDDESFALGYRDRYIILRRAVFYVETDGFQKRQD